MNPSSHDEPAIRPYFSGRGWANAGRAFTRCILTAWDEAGLWFARLENLNWMSPIHAGIGVGSLAIGIAVALAAGAASYLILICGFCIWVIVVGILWITDCVSRLWWKVGYHCPICHATTSRPMFACECGTVHRSLSPNQFGAFYHRCRNCKRKLGATGITHRARFPAYCPQPGCGEPIAGKSTTPIVIGIAGGPSQGKTSLLCRALLDLQHLAPSFNWELRGHDPQDMRRLEEMRIQLEADAIPKTSVHSPYGWRFYLTTPRRKIDRLLCFYDPAGEHFLSASSAQNQRYLAQMAGLIFVIDPFALPDVQDQWRSFIQAHHHQIKPGTNHPRECFRNLTSALENLGVVTSGKPCPLPLALVICKVDALGMLDAITAAPGHHTEDRVWTFLESHGWPNVRNEVGLWFSNIQIYLSGRHVSGDAPSPLRGQIFGPSLLPALLGAKIPTP